MKERWKLVEDHFEDPKKPTYYLIEQKQIWRFYFRVIKEHFTPCDRCQKEIEKLWGYETGNGLCFDRAPIEHFVHSASVHLCKSCLAIAMKLAENAEIIPGNKNYEPPVELSRIWDLADERNPKTINLTESEYKRILEFDGHEVYILPQWLLVKRKTTLK